MTTPTPDQCRENALYALTRLSHGYPYEDPNASFDNSLDIETVQAAIQSRPTEEQACETCKDDPATCAMVTSLRHCEAANREQPAGDRREALDSLTTIATLDKIMEGQ